MILSRNDLTADMPGTILATYSRDSKRWLFAVNGCTCTHDHTKLTDAETCASRVIRESRVRVVNA